MKPDLITISVIMIFCILLPFILLPIINYVERTRLISKFKGEAVKYKLNIEQKERWNLSMLGIDPIQKKLLFVQKRNDIFTVELIDLLTVKESKLVPFSVKSRAYKNPASLLRRIDLQLIFLPDHGTKNLNLFDSRLNLYKEMELYHAEKWNLLIHKYLPIGQLLPNAA